MLEFFSSYIKNFLSVAICAFLCESASSLSEKGKSMSRALSLICSLCVFLAATFPLLSTIRLFSGQIQNTIKSTDTETVYEDEEFTKLMKQQLEEQLAKDIYDNTGILSDSICIDLSIENQEFIINSIQVSKKGCTDKEAVTVKNRILEIFGNEITITFTE